MSEAPHRRLHPDELDIDAALVHRLLVRQFPQWAGLTIAAVPSGTDNLTFRLGADLAVRLPRMPAAAPRLLKEARWLPRLAPSLTVAVPVPLALGEPDEGYPLPWAVVHWIHGEEATGAAAGSLTLARQLAAFVAALRAIDTEGGPAPGEHNSGRGVPLAERDERTRAAIAELKGTIDTRLATEVWETALAADHWQGAPAWIHGDLHASNLLVTGDRLAGILDFGCLGVGDPACDLMVAWAYLTREAREAFRQALTVDDASWRRGRGWALSVGLIALPYYRGRDAVMTAMATHAISEALDDHRRAGAVET